MEKKKKKAPRRRLSAEAARAAILAATEKRLRDHGPDALRLQDIARDVGMSHPTVLHHVGNRETLVSVVATRAMLALEHELLACFTSDAGPIELASTLAQIDDVMRTHGRARLLAWLALTQPGGGVKEDSRLGDVTVALHATRKALGSDAPYEDTAFGAMLASVGMFGFALLGPKLLTMMGLPADERTLVRFREWFAALLLEHAGIPAPPGHANQRP